MNETTFDPASKTERSVRVIKETGTSQNRSQQQATSVQQNIPQQQAGRGAAVRATIPMKRITAARN